MIHKTITPAQVGVTLSRASKVIEKAQLRAMLEAAALGAEMAARSAPVDTGRLKQSVRLRKKGASGHPEIVADAPYAGIVEAGSRPHWAPLQPLIKWVRRHVNGAARAAGIKTPSVVGVYKGHSPRAWAAYNRRSRIREQYVGEILGMARGIQLKIAHKGTKPTWFMRRNLPRMSQALGVLLAEAKVKALREIAAGKVGP